ELSQPSGPTLAATTNTAVGVVGGMGAGATPSGAKRARRGPRPHELEDEDSSLFAIIKQGRGALQQIADEWIQQYKQDRDAALVRLLQFFISSSGCKGRITMQMYLNDSYAEIIRKMTEQFDEDSGEYPLIMTGPVWRKFRSSFVDFITILIRQCQYSVIYDQFMTDTVISLLTGLTDSQVRAFRHTSTLAAVKLVTALVEVSLSVSINLDNTQRQYDAERLKAQNRRAHDRLDGLLKNRQKLQENLEEIKTMITYLFKGVFIHRYRDSQAEIRTICIQEIGQWMKKMPNVFLEDSYLKYVGWTLYDRVSEVRLTCLKSLQPLYEDPNAVNKLELFSSRFKSRILDMTLDKDSEVAVEAVRCVTCMLRNLDRILDDKDAENIYELVYSSHRPLAVAAAEFLNLKLFQLDEHAPQLRTKKGKKRSQNTVLLRDLVQFFIESELNEHAAYLVDSFFDINDMLRDWEAMIDLLLEEPGRGEEPLGDLQESSLIEILACCARQAATGESPVGRQASRKQLTNREMRQVQEDKQRLTEHLIPTLAQLILKYGEDTGKMLNLLSLVQYMDLDMFVSTRQEKHLDLLLKYMQESIVKHTETEVLLSFARVFESLTQEELQIGSKCLAVLSTLIDRLVESYKQAYLNYFQEERPDEDDKYALVSALKRIFAFYSYHDLTSWDLWISLLTIFRSAQERPFYYEEVVARGIGCAYFALFWQQYRQMKEGQPDKNEQKDLKKCVELFFQVTTAYLSHDEKSIATEAYVSICDLLVVFSRHNEPAVAGQAGDRQQPAGVVSFVADAGLQSGLVHFMQRRVFVEDDPDTDEDAKIEELHNRRTHLACFAKLVVYNCVPLQLASNMFVHYIRFYNDFGDIMKTTLQKCKEINKRETTLCIAATLQKAFSQLPANSDRGSPGFVALKDLARRFNLSFGLDAAKVRELMRCLHEEGVKFALADWDPASPAAAAPPHNLAFFDVLAEFSNKLLREDKAQLAQWLRTGWQVRTNGLGPQWQSLIYYLSSLESPDGGGAEGSISGATGSVVGGGPGRGSGQRGRPKRQRDSSMTPSMGGGQGQASAVAPSPGATAAAAASTSIQSAAGAGGPQAVSTAVKRSRRDQMMPPAENLATPASTSGQQQQQPPQSHGPTTSVLQLRSHQQFLAGGL
ncbi:hypothetical protein BOX15_Mlig017969g1, partial [Macrostomum lignano]